MMRTQLCFRGEPPVEVALFEDPKRGWRCWVSRDGRAFSYRKGRRGYHEYKQFDIKGYMQVNSSFCSHSSRFFCHEHIHLIVLSAWVGPKPGPDYQCDHIDYNRHNNNLNNLRWITRAENHARRREQVRYDWTIEVRGKKDNKLIATLHSPLVNQYWTHNTEKALEALESCFEHFHPTRNYNLVVTKTPKNKQIIDL